MTGIFSSWSDECHPRRYDMRRQVMNYFAMGAGVSVFALRLSFGFVALVPSGNGMPKRLEPAWIGSGISASQASWSLVNSATFSGVWAARSCCSDASLLRSNKPTRAFSPASRDRGSRRLHRSRATLDSTPAWPEVPLAK